MNTAELEAPTPLASRLLDAGAAHPAVSALADRLAASGAAARLRGAAGSAGALVAALLLGRLKAPLAVIAPDLDRAEAWRDDLSFLLGADRVVFLPPLDTVPWSAQGATLPVREDRLTALLRIGDADPPVIVIPAGVRWPPRRSTPTRSRAISTPFRRIRFARRSPRR